MKLDLDHQHQQFREEVRAFIQEYLTPEIQAGHALTTNLYAPPSVSVPWQRALAAKGWLAPLWPTEWGGCDWTGLQRFIFETETALAGAPVIHPMGLRLLGPVLIKYGSQAQKEHYLPRILASEDYWCQGFSEPQAGSDLASLRMRADREGDHYVINGSKLWTTQAHYATHMFALVRTADTPRKHDGISMVLIDMRQSGVTVRPIRTIGGDHETNEVFFDNVRIPVSDLVGQENHGWEYARYLLEFERGVGIFSPRLRAQFKRIQHTLEQRFVQLTQDDLRRLGDLAADIDTLEWLELRTLGALKPGDRPGPDASILKLKVSRTKQAIAEIGVDLLGEHALRWSLDQDSGYQSEALLVREYCNSRAYTIFGGAAEIQLGLLYKAIVA